MSQPDSPKPTGARALLYLRVSTVDQAKRGGEAEGYSLPAQREACIRKAESLGAIAVGEYVDGGESARTDKRTALQQMLGRIKAERDVDMVIVHKVNRWARNREDDALLGIVLRKARVQLVSAVENIDATPTGRLTHGILATLAEYESANLAEEVIKGMTQKVKHGGTPGRAPIGYLNASTVIDGHEVRGIVLDPERADPIRWAFEVYASGDHSLIRLLAELTDKGLTTRPTRRVPAHPLHLSQLHRLLQNGYYMGVVFFRGVQYKGHHEPLVSPETFDQAQSILVAHRNGEKQRTHNHYLRGNLFCGVCRSRLCFTAAKGRGGTYPYYFCINRHQRGGCHQPYMPVEAIEKEIEAKYRSIQLSSVEADELRELIRHSAKRLMASNRKEVERQERRMKRLDRERTKLLQAHYADAIPIDLLKAEQSRISRETADAQAEIRMRQTEFAAIEANLDKTLRLASDCGRQYAKAPPIVKRLFNQAFFERFVIEYGKLVEAIYTEPFTSLQQVAEAKRRIAGQFEGNTAKGRGVTYLRMAGGRGSVPKPVLVGLGLKEELLVTPGGFEPPSQP